MQSETKLDGSLKTLVQTKSRHQKNEDLKLVFAKSLRRGQNIPSHYKEIAKAQNKDQ